MTSTDKFQVLPNYYNTVEESKQRKPVQTNPRYKEFKQTHFTAGEEDQFHEFRNLSNNKVTIITNEEIKNNVFSDMDFSSIIEWEKYKNLNAVSVTNTFNYLFHKFKKGIFVKIQNNKLVTFLPFSKKNFVNEWGNKIKVDPKFKDMNTFIQHINKLSGDKQKTIVNGHVDTWYANNCLVRYEYPINEGDSNVCNFRDMLDTLCLSRKIPDMEFFINRRDFPQLTKNETEAYEHIFGDNQKLLSHSYQKYAPLLSMATTDNNADIPIPTGDDWARISKEENKFFTCSKVSSTPEIFSIEWKDKKPTAIFRGSSTGAGVTIDTNIRLKASYISATLSKNSRKNLFEETDSEYPLLDAGITRWQLRPRKIKDEEYLKTIDVALMNKKGIHLVNFMSAVEQSTYKYLLHLDGHVSAFRLSLEMSMGCCILLPDSKYKLWFRNMLKPMVHFVPVKSDLSDLLDKIIWCRKNDKDCERIANNAKIFYLKYLQKDGILDYLQKLFIDLKKHTGNYFYNYKSPLDTQIEIEFERNKKIIHPKTLKTVADIKTIPKQGRSFGLLKGLEWIINMVNANSSFIESAIKSDSIFSSDNVFVCKYKFAGYVFAVKTSSSNSKIKENIHEAFIGSNAINEIIKYIPNFAYIFGIDSKDNSVIMEYISGITFSDWIKSDSFNFQDYIFILIQICFALEVAQNQCGFVHYDLTTWNIIIQKTPLPVSFDYVMDDGIVYRINTHLIPIIIDYGKSHIIHNNIHYGYINMFNTSTIQDVISLILTSVNDIIKFSLAKVEVKDLLKVMNFLSGTKYRKSLFTCTGPNGISDIKFFIERSKKYTEMVFSDKGELEEKCPLDFIDYLKSSFSFSFPVEKVDSPTFKIYKGNPNQVFKFILSSDIKEKIKSFTDVFDDVNDRNLKNSDVVVSFYNLQQLELNISSTYDIFKKFVASEGLNENVYSKHYKDCMTRLGKYHDRLKKMKLSDTLETILPDKLEKAEYTSESFLQPELVLSLFKKNNLNDLTVYKQMLNSVLLNKGVFSISDSIKEKLRAEYETLLDTKSINMKAKAANNQTLIQMSNIIYKQDRDHLNNLLLESKDTTDISKHISELNKILELL